MHRCMHHAGFHVLLNCRPRRVGNLHSPSAYSECLRRRLGFHWRLHCSCQIFPLSAFTAIFAVRSLGWISICLQFIFAYLFLFFISVPGYLPSYVVLLLLSSCRFPVSDNLLNSVYNLALVTVNSCCIVPCNFLSFILVS